MGLPATLMSLVRGRKAPPVPRAQMGAGVTYLSAADPASSKRMGDYRSYLGAITIPDVYKCCSVIAQNFAATPLRILDEHDEELDIKQRMPAFWELLRRPNPEMRGRHFLQTLSHHYQLTGNAICLKDNYSGLGAPSELWPLRPDRVHIIRSDIGRLAYGYDVEENRTTKTYWYDGDDILHVKSAHPNDNLFGLGVIEAGELSFSKNRLVNEFALNFFNRGAIVDGILTTDREIPEEDRRALVSDWRAMRDGARNKLRTALLWAGATYTPIQEPLGRVPIMDLTKMSRNDICELFGTPPQLLGDFEGTNYRNAQESSAFFWGETMAPILAQFAEDFWNPLLEAFDPSVRAEYEQREVVDYQMRADAAAKLAGTGAFAVNDLRVAAGYDPLPEDDELGALIPLPKGMTLLSPEQALALGEEVQEAPEELPPGPQVTELGQPASAAPGAEQELPQGQGAGAQATGGPQTAPETPATKSASSAMRGQKTYPAALLSPQVRQRQRRAQMQASGGRRGATEGSVEGQPVLRLLSGTKEKEEEGADAPSLDAASAPALPGARTAPSPPRPSGAAAPADERSGPSTRTVAVSARPKESDLARLKQAYLAWSAQDDGTDWEDIAAGLAQRGHGDA